MSPRLIAIAISGVLSMTALARDGLIPVVTGTVGGRTFVTTVVASNRSAADTTCVFTYHRSGHTNETLTSTETIPAHTALVFEDFLSEIAAAGTVRTRCSSDVNFVIRIQDSLDGGKTFGDGRVFRPLDPHNSISTGSKRTVRTTADVVLAEITGKSVHVDVAAASAQGVIYGRKSYDIAPYAQRVINLEQVRTQLSSVEVTIAVTSGEGSIVFGSETREPTLANVARHRTATGKTAASRQLLSCPFKAAPFLDPMTGLCYMRDRWYAPRAGAFLSADRAGYRDSSDLFVFCAGDPVNCSDPTGLAASIGLNGWIVATDNRNGGRIVRFSPRDIARDPQRIRAFLGLRADVDARQADAMIERAAAWATNRDKLRALAPNVAKAAGVYPLMAATAGAGIGGGAGVVASGELGLGFVGSSMLSGFTGGIGSRAGADVSARHASGIRKYAADGSVGAVAALAFGSAFAGAGRLIDGPVGTATIEGAVPPDWYIPDGVFVRFDAPRFDAAIDRNGYQQAIFADQKVWLTRYGYVRDLENAADLETILYRQDLWPMMRGRFGKGATLRLVSNADDAVLAGTTNRVNGVPQWRLTRDVPPSDLQVIKRLPGYE